jgi:hypothetical protein
VGMRRFGVSTGRESWSVCCCEIKSVMEKMLLGWNSAVGILATYDTIPCLRMEFDTNWIATNVKVLG